MTFAPYDWSSVHTPLLRTGCAGVDPMLAKRDEPKTWRYFSVRPVYLLDLDQW
jgi:hypothetical protein